MKDVPVCGKGVPRNDCSAILSNGCITALLSESSTGVDTYPCKQLVSRGENKGFLLKEIQTYPASSLSAWGRRRGFPERGYRLTQPAAYQHGGEQGVPLEEIQAYYWVRECIWELTMSRGGGPSSRSRSSPCGRASQLLGLGQTQAWLNIEQKLILSTSFSRQNMYIWVICL